MVVYIVEMIWPLRDVCQSQETHSGGVDTSKVLRRERERVEGVRGKEASVKGRKEDELVSRYPLEI